MVATEVHGADRSTLRKAKARVAGGEPCRAGVRGPPPVRSEAGPRPGSGLYLFIVAFYFFIAPVFWARPALYFSY